MCRRVLHLDISTSTVGVSLSPYIMRELTHLATHMRTSLGHEAVGPAMARRLAAMKRPQVPLASFLHCLGNISSLSCHARTGRRVPIPAFLLF